MTDKPVTIHNVLQPDAGTTFRRQHLCRSRSALPIVADHQIAFLLSVHLNFQRAVF